MAKWNVKCSMCGTEGIPSKDLYKVRIQNQQPGGFGRTFYACRDCLTNYTMEVELPSDPTEQDMKDWEEANMKYKAERAAKKLGIQFTKEKENK